MTCMQVALADGQSKLEETLQQEIPFLEFCKIQLLELTNTDSIPWVAMFEILEISAIYRRYG